MCIRDSLMGADGEKWITATMVGNYARQGVIPRSEGKRYGREHAAYLIFVCLSKQVIAIGDIQQLIALQRRTEFNVAVAYDYFCTELESILAHVFNGAPLRPDSSRTHARETHLVRAAGVAVAHKIYLSQYPVSYTHLVFEADIIFLVEETLLLDTSHIKNV